MTHARKAPSKVTPSTYPTHQMNDLFDAVTTLRTKEEVAKFFRDLLTIPEVTEFANRWQMVKYLVQGKSYASIANELHTSTATVSRVAYWLYHGEGGYRLTADRLFGIHGQLPRRGRKVKNKPLDK